MTLTDLRASLLPELTTDLHDHISWQAVDQGTQQVHGDLATWWVQATAAVNYYRADMPAKHLPGRIVSFNPTDVQPDGRGDYLFRRQKGAAVWLFPGNVTRWILMAQMKALGYRVLVEVDDNYTTHPPIPQISSWLATRDKTGDDKHSYECHRKIVQSGACDAVIVSTPKLAEVYRRLHREVHVCPNSIDPDDWPEGEPPHQRNGLLRIGWAGSWSHLYDIADIRPALDWASRQKGVRVRVLGFNPPWRMKHTHIGWTETLADYRRNVAHLDVMLCPIRSSAWADCKSDVKALEAAMGGACAVVSRTEPYRPWWAGDGPGYSARTPKDYLKIVKHLVANRDEVRETARLAREYVLRERTIGTSIRHWREAIG